MHALAGGTAASFRVIWNDALGVALMVAYGLVVNLPLIAIQRSSRGRTDRILTARSRRSVVAARG